MPIREGIEISEEDAKQYDYHIAQSIHFNRLQHIKKIALNSVYGATGNANSHFFMIVCAEACTLGAQGVTHHMISEVGRQINGDYSIYAKSIKYADTDSCYFDVSTAEDKVAHADDVADKINSTFYDYMRNTHNCNELQANRITLNREIVADCAIFVTKKRYAMHVIDNEGKKTDEIKIIGLDVKKSGTPNIIKDMLNSALEGILHKNSKVDVDAMVLRSRKIFNTSNIMEIGVPGKVNGVDDYTQRLKLRKLYDEQRKLNLMGQQLPQSDHKALQKIEQNDPSRWEKIIKGKTCYVPGNVRAAINWNTLIMVNGDNVSPKITTGMKIKVFNLTSNSYGFDTIAIPTDISMVPKYFQQLPFDKNLMETKLIDAKLEMLYEPIGWELPKIDRLQSAFGDLLIFD